MGKTTGFIEFQRETATYVSPLDRIKNYDEFSTKLDDRVLKEQGARCMDCGIPFCHTGTNTEFGLIGCPLSNLIPEFNDLVYKDDYEKAYERLSITNCFPEFTGKVCPAPCEGSCTLGMIKPPVTIKNMEYAIIEQAFNHDLVSPNLPKGKIDKRVVIVGSGPSGLAAAHTLIGLGVDVTVYERDDRAGGLLMYGIPNMKLDKSTVLRRVSLLEEAGVKFVYNTEVGKDILVKDLKQENDAIIICTGATKPRGLNVDGSNLPEIIYAVDFLRASTKNLLDNSCEKIDTKGKRVVVVGGGDTGTDCVGTSIRQGAQSVIQLEIMGKLPEIRGENNPWPYYPRVLKTDYGQEEAIAVFGHDPRIYNTTIKRIIGNNKLEQIETVKVSWDKGYPEEIAGTEEIIDCDILLLAMGFLGPEDTIANELNLKRDKRSNIIASDSDYKTNKTGVFAAGDTRRGQSLVVWAIREGKMAGKACYEFLTEDY